MNSTIAEDREEVKFQCTVLSFAKKFNVVKCFQEAGIRKEKGYSLKEIITFLITLIFTHKTFYALMKICSVKKPFDKDVIYRFFDNPWNNWRLCLVKIAALVINNHLYGLTRPYRARCIVIDDSIYERDRSTKVELLAWVRDHCKNVTKRGFRMLTLGWTDGVSFIPLAFSLLSSQDKEKRICEANPDIPPDSPGFSRRQEADPFSETGYWDEQHKPSDLSSAKLEYVNLETFISQFPVEQFWACRIVMASSPACRACFDFGCLSAGRDFTKWYIFKFSGSGGGNCVRLPQQVSKCES